jgi:hypothetical protein
MREPIRYVDARRFLTVFPLNLGVAGRASSVRHASQLVLAMMLTVANAAGMALANELLGVVRAVALVAHEARTCHSDGAAGQHVGNWLPPPEEKPV